MEWDLGLQGMAILVGIAIGFGIVAEVVGWRASPWIGLASGIGALVVAAFVSEVMFAGVTEEDVQPVIDGLAFDEALLGGLIGALAGGGAMWLAVRWTHHGGGRTTPQAPTALPR